MELLINLDGRDATTEAAELCDWLNRARIKDIREVRQKEAPPKPGEQGPELLAVLTVVLAAPATVALVHTLHRWIEARKPKVMVRIKRPDGKTIEIDAENPSSIEDVVIQAKALAQD